MQKRPATRAYLSDEDGLCKLMEQLIFSDGCGQLRARCHDAVSPGVLGVTNYVTDETCVNSVGVIRVYGFAHFLDVGA